MISLFVLPLALFRLNQSHRIPPLSPSPPLPPTLPHHPSPPTLPPAAASIPPRSRGEAERRLPSLQLFGFGRRILRLPMEGRIRRRRLRSPHAQREVRRPQATPSRESEMGEWVPQLSLELCAAAGAGAAGVGNVELNWTLAGSGGRQRSTGESKMLSGFHNWVRGGVRVYRSWVSGGGRLLFLRLYR